jgi:hypothetical protein
MKLEFRQTVTCNHLTLARVCKTIDWQQPLPRCGEYVAGTAGAQTAAPGTGRRLPCGAAGLQHCTAAAFLPGTGAVGSTKGLDAAKAVKNLNFPLAFWLIRAIIVRQSFPRPLDGVADIEGCDGHIHL